MGYTSANSFSASCLTLAPHSRTSSASRWPYFGIYSRVTLLSSTAIGLRSLAKASAPTRSASSGMEPPPAKGSTTSGRVPGTPPNASCAAWVSARLVSRYAGTVELSQLAKSAMKSSSARRNTSGSSSRSGSFWVATIRAALSALASRRYSCAQSSIRSRATSRECLRTDVIRRVRPQRRANHRPTRGQRSPRPPDVQRRDMPVPDRLLAPRMGGDALDRQIDFDEALGILGDSHSGISLSCCLFSAARICSAPT